MKSPVQSLHSTMQTLYDSECYSVLHTHMVSEPDKPSGPGAAHTPTLSRHGFEIVDKHSGKGVYLDGLWAEEFQKRILAWQQRSPTQEEVEDTLASYAALAQNPRGIVH